MAEEASTKPPRRETYWPGTLLQLYTVFAFFYGLYFLNYCSYTTIFFHILLISLGALGTMAGSHRLWAHRSYEGTTILRIFLMLCQTLNFHGSIYDWVLDHRIHHKFHGTEDDPYNYKYGWFNAHMGHTMRQESPKRKELEKEIDMSDMEADGVVMLQKRFYWILGPIVGILLPINAPAEYWGETILNSIMVLGLQRISINYHLDYLVNSAQTIWGLTPGDRFFLDSNWVYVIRKSYWHEYHYTVPWDYLTNEFGSYNCGCTTVFIKVWAALGLAYGLRTIDSWGVRRAVENFVTAGNDKSLVDCINDMEEPTKERLPEDYYLFDRTNWPQK